MKLVILIAGVFALYLCLEFNLFKLPKSKHRIALRRVKKTFPDYCIEKTAPQPGRLSPPVSEYLPKEQPEPGKQEEDRDAVSEPGQKWSPVFQSFVKEYIEPHQNSLEYNNYLPCIDKILKILAGHGDCPSVAPKYNNEKETEYTQLASSYEILKRVTLSDHTFNVVTELVESIRKKKDYRVSIGKWLITGLGHDLGKIPEFRTGAYVTGDHPIISRSILENILPEDLPARDDILNAVRDHHFEAAQSEMTVALREADFKARSAEIKSIYPLAALELLQIKQHQKKEPENTGVPHTVDLSWMNKEAFISILENKINRFENNIFRAFSMNNGMVYVWLETISEIVLDLAKRKNRTEITKEKPRNIEYSIRTLFGDYVPDYIGPGYAGAKFKLSDQNNKPLHFGLFLPLKAELFPASLADLEKRKKSRLLKVKDVEPLIRKKTA